MKDRVDLQEMIDKITPDNVHPEADWGLLPVGEEVLPEETPEDFLSAACPWSGDEEECEACQ